jgi:hypothetical protein
VWTNELDIEAWPLRSYVHKCIKEGHVFTPKSFAVVSLFYGNDIETLLLGLALGASIQQNTKHNKLLLITDDVPAHFRTRLAAFWTLREVNEIHCDPMLVVDRPMFRRVFNKLHIFNKKVIKCDRVLYLDLDTIVMSNVDDILESGHAFAGVPCPSARNKMGEKKSWRYPAEWSHLPVGCSFNGGVLLIEPNNAVFNTLVRDCARASVWHVPSSAPESFYLRDLLSWKTLDVRMNIIPQLTKGQGNSDRWRKCTIEDVKVFHYASSAKVWYWWYDNIMIPLPQRGEYIDAVAEEFLAKRVAYAFDVWMRTAGVSLSLTAVNDGLFFKASVREAVVCLTMQHRAFRLRIRQLVFCLVRVLCIKRLMSKLLVRIALSHLK